MRPLSASAVAVLAFALSVAAAAERPAGFYEARVLEPAMSFVAAKRMRAWCSVTVADYGAWRATQPGQGGFSRGATVVGANETHLSVDVCRPLRAQLRGRKPDRYELAGALTALVHESIHARGIRDEGETECRAMRETPRVAVKFFRVKPGRQLRALMTEAWAYHRDVLPPEYRTIC